MEKANLYISKSSISKELLTSFAESGYEVTPKSLITFKSVKYFLPYDEGFEWIFFGSKTAVRYFAKRHIFFCRGYKIAAVGESTKVELEKLGLNVDFVGENSSDVSEIAKTFASSIGKDRVLFPQSSVSRKTVQKELEKNQILDLLVYNTILKEEKFEKNFDTLAFTSPSNVEAFLLKNEINADAKVISWGKTTSAFLESKGVAIHHELKNSSFEELSDFLQRS